MKKIISAILVCVLTLGIVFTLSSCNMVMGTYEGGTVELKFGLGKVTIAEGEEEGVKYIQIGTFGKFTKK